ncbi:MAG: penicillin-binding transpeptidase domain-containing protein [Candidatus Paceibacterota bacterium]|jgi:penicillin-binding protein 2
MFKFLNIKRKKYTEINPDEIFMDSSNIPGYDRSQLEGRIEKPIKKFALYSIFVFFGLVATAFFIQIWNLQIIDGKKYASRSEGNMLRPIPIFAARGTISDRNGVLIVWNEPSEEKNIDLILSQDEINSVSKREYATTSGMAHIQGYVQYPLKDKNGFYYQEDFEGIDGAEEYFNDRLRGVNGSRLVEVDARGQIVSESVVRPAKPGENIKLSIDSRIQSNLYKNIKDIAERVGFVGGAGVIMDINTGEVLAMASYPEFDSQIMSDKEDQNAVISALTNKSLPFLNRAIDGLYVPGSIIKPYIALGVLNEKIIDPLKIVNETGSIFLTNPYDPTKSTIFRDWKSLGFVDMKHAIALSSDVYFYVVGGGYKDQKGLGIINIDKYLQMFGFGMPISKSFFSGKTGTIPTPEWKKITFDEDWYIGDTYHTAIGQYGMQVTPIQVARAVSAIANSGSLLVPTLEIGQKQIESTIDIPIEYFNIVREGMSMSVNIGTSKALNVPYTKIAGKSGTAELGVTKEKVNSWITGFWPYENPKYAFAVILEKGSVHNLIGAAAVMRQQLDWMAIYTPEYFK